jgi:hypothetical protein
MPESCWTCGAEHGRRVAFFRNGPIDGRAMELPSYPFLWRVPMASPLAAYLKEEANFYETKVAIYERTDIVFRGARVYIYRREESF